MKLFVLRGPRIEMRLPRRTDVPVLKRYLGDQSVVRYAFGPRQYGDLDVCGYVWKSRWLFKQQEAYHLVIVDHDNTLIGGLSISSNEWRHRTATLGCWIARPYRRAGYASEAIQVALRFCFRTLKLMRVQAYVFSGNEASRKLLDKLGFSCEGYLRKRFFNRRRYIDTYLYSILRNEWKARKARR